MISFPWQKSFRNWKREFSMQGYMNIQVIVLQLMGMWPIEYANYLPECLHFLSTFLNVVFYALNLALQFFITICLVITLFLRTDGLDEFSNYVLMVIAYIFMTFIRVYFIWKYREMKNLIDYLNQNVRQRSAVGLTYITIEPSYKYTTFLVVAWVGMCTAGTVHWAMWPFIVRERILPFESWYPFDESKSPAFEIMYILQSIAQFHCGVIYGIASGLYASFAMLISGQFDILFCSLKNTYNTALIKAGEDGNKLMRMQSSLDWKDEEVNQYHMGKELLEDLEELNITNDTAIVSTGMIDHYLTKALVDSIRHHVVVLQLSKKIDELFRFYLLVILFQIISITCFLAYLMNVSNDSKLLNILEYLSLVQSELLMFSYFAEVLKYQSSQVGTALLRSPWYLYGTKVKKTVLIVLGRSMKPVVLTAQKMYVMDTGCMAAVVKTSFSFYTLLLTLRNN